ncbi:MAG: NIPSNAP family protein [Chloroflexi bacterium]|nr:NIPSNAP family protein [Chloroflexota bacterium]
MLYVEYRVEVMIADMEEYHKLMGKFLKIVDKNGAETLGVWRTAVGDRQEIVILERYKNMGHFEEVRSNLEKEPGVKELLTRLGRIRKVWSKFMTPVSYSPMQ